MRHLVDNSVRPTSFQVGRKVFIPSDCLRDSSTEESKVLLVDRLNKRVRFLLLLAWFPFACPQWNELPFLDQADGATDLAMTVERPHLAAKPIHAPSRPSKVVGPKKIITRLLLSTDLIDQSESNDLEDDWDVSLPFFPAVLFHPPVRTGILETSSPTQIEARRYGLISPLFGSHRLRC
jgi:hypothetical protein